MKKIIYRTMYGKKITVVLKKSRAIVDSVSVGNGINIVDENGQWWLSVNKSISKDEIDLLKKFFGGEISSKLRSAKKNSFSFRVDQEPIERMMNYMRFNARRIAE